MKLFYAICILFSINVSLVSMKHILAENQIKPEENDKNFDEFYSVGVTLIPIKDPIDSTLRKDASDLFDKVLVEVQEWVKISTRELNDNVVKVVKLIDQFIGFLKDIQPTIIQDPIQDTDAPEVKLKKYILELIKELAVRTQHMLQLIKLDPNASPSDIEEYKNSLLNQIHNTFINAKKVFNVINDLTEKKAVMTDTLDMAKEIDGAIRKLYPSTTVGRILYFGGEKIVKKVEALIQMYIKELGY